MNSIQRSKKQWKLNNPEKSRAYCSKSKAKRRAENLSKVNAIKELQGCKDCPEKDPVVLDFHHRDPKKKKFIIGWAVQQPLSWGKISKEIAKCDVLCANDHRRREHKRRQVLKRKHGK